MIQFGMASYLVAALFYTVFSILLATAWRGRVLGGLLLLAAVLSMVWSIGGAFAGAIDWFGVKSLLALEVLRNAGWTIFLWYALSFTKISSGHRWFNVPVLSYACLCLVTVAAELSVAFSGWLPDIMGGDFRIFSHCMQALIGLILLEQLYRNTRIELRWGIKFLCLGLGGLFVYDFTLYTTTLLFNTIDQDLWQARGLVNAALVPLIGISVSRNPHWSLDMFVSRTVVFHTTALMATGIYLLSIALIGYYVKDFGGSWGRVWQVFFVSSAIMVLLLLLFSGRIRASVKVFFNQHFFTYKYDYRKEWIGLSRRLTEQQSTELVRENSIIALAEIVDSTSGVLWEKQESGVFALTAEFGLQIDNVEPIPRASSLIQFLEQTQWVIEVPEYIETPEMYGELNLAPWTDAIDKLWLVVPLMQKQVLHGFICLTESRARREINWEDHDLLKTVGQQLASYLVMLETSEALANARQFEAFNRLSAFVVHDLNNLVAQISLLVKNAEKHKHNPDFIDDMVDTLSNSVDKMNRMLGQLRKTDMESYAQPQTEAISQLADILRQAVDQQCRMKPEPTLDIVDGSPAIRLDNEQFVAVLGHLIRNAQDATHDDGWVKLSLSKTENQAIITIADNGSGMSADFVRERLFRPFDTTKGNAGMGIGVYEARQFIHNLGGRLGVESEPGVGTTFEIRLPVLENNAAANDGDEPHSH